MGAGSLCERRAMPIAARQRQVFSMPMAMEREQANREAPVET
jgi:hypothetical protein